MNIVLPGPGFTDRQRQAEIATKPLDLLFEIQRAAIEAPDRFKALLVGRRGGKTSGIRSDIANILLHEQAGSDTLFASQTSETARELCWVPLERGAREHGWPIHFDQSKRIATGPKGARLLVEGTETLRDLERKRGPGFRHMRIDECGAIRPSYLKYLVEDVLEPMMMDSAESDMILSGTPGPAQTGYWWEITTGQGQRAKWPTFHWTWRHNPYLDPDFVPEHVLKKRGWDEDNPTYRREYLAQWFSDPTRLVFRWRWDRNCLDGLPTLHPQCEWRYAFGLDFGIGDATALVVIAYPQPVGRDAYLVDSWQVTGMAPSDVAAKVMKSYETYSPDVMVGDSGGIGAAFIAEWNKWHPGIPLVPAKKPEKRARVEFVSDLLYTARMHEQHRERRGLFSLRGNHELNAQLASLLWNEDRTDISEGQDDNLANAAVYGLSGCPIWAQSGEPVYGDLRHPDPKGRAYRKGFQAPEDSRYQELAAAWRGDTASRWKR